MRPGPGDVPAGEQAPPLGESARRIGSAGQALGQELRAVARALYALFLADLALSRHAVVRVAILAASAVVLALSAWFWLMAGGVLGLHRLGLPWWAALGSMGLFLLLLTLLCLWRARQALSDTRFTATRRQLARLGQALKPDAAAAPSAPESES